jgi:hypothetical protein
MVVMEAGIYPRADVIKLFCVVYDF